jgi:hypothetical protein
MMHIRANNNYLVNTKGTLIWIKTKYENMTYMSEMYMSVYTMVKVSQLISMWFDIHFLFAINIWISLRQFGTL